jgi:hypothetical protein
MKFKPGDLVWALVKPLSDAAWHGVPPGEIPGVITGVYTAPDEAYSVDLPGYIAPSHFRAGWWGFHYQFRPRRDDYQQHEGLGSMDEIRKLLTHHEPA